MKGIFRRSDEYPPASINRILYRDEFNDVAIVRPAVPAPTASKAKHFKQENLQQKKKSNANIQKKDIYKTQSQLEIYVC